MISQCRLQESMTWNAIVWAEIQKRWRPGQSFVLQDLYKLEPKFNRAYPQNSFVRAKIRQTLQSLRDQGLVRFVDNAGTYERLG